MIDGIGSLPTNFLEQVYQEDKIQLIMMVSDLFKEFIRTTSTKKHDTRIIDEIGSLPTNFLEQVYQETQYMYHLNVSDLFPRIFWKEMEGV